MNRPDITTASSRQAPTPGFASRAMNRLVGMDRAEEFYLVAAALCAFGSALIAQKRHA